MTDALSLDWPVVCVGVVAGEVVLVVEVVVVVDWVFVDVDLELPPPQAAIASDRTTINKMSQGARVRDFDGLRARRDGRIVRVT